MLHLSTCQYSDSFCQKYYADNQRCGPAGFGYGFSVFNRANERHWQEENRCSDEEHSKIGKHRFRPYRAGYQTDNRRTYIQRRQCASRKGKQTYAPVARAVDFTCKMMAKAELFCLSNAVNQHNSAYRYQTYGRSACRNSGGRVDYRDYRRYSTVNQQSAKHKAAEQPVRLTDAFLFGHYYRQNDVAALRHARRACTESDE